MSVFLKEGKYLLISIAMIILDGLFGYFIPCYFNQLNYFFPMLTISFLPFVILSKKGIYIITMIIGIIYDTLYSSIFLYNTIIFIVLVSLNMKIIKHLADNLLSYIMLSVINIIIYDTICFLLVISTDYAVVSFEDLIYKISHSIILNIMSVIVFWFLCKNDLHHA